MQILHKTWQTIDLYGRMIKFSHTIFALPFALSAVVLASRSHTVTLGDLFWILVALVGARSAAMGVNRIADVRFDAANPRTANREIPSGRLPLLSAKLFVALFSVLFVLAAAMLGTLCFRLSFPVLGVLFFYSYTKRFTWTAHLWLGFAISLAPLGAWIAVADTLSWRISLLSVALMAYIAGFDILYACQDADFDRKEGLFSIPARFSVKNALRLSAAVHAVAFLSLLALYFAFSMGNPYLLTVCVIGFLLILEHRLIDADDLSRIDVAFFHVNSAISVILFLGIAADEVTRRVFPV